MMEVGRVEEFKMPPVGITQTRLILAGIKYVKFSVRCGEEGCWFAGGSFPTEEQANRYLDDHKTGRTPYSVPACPAPPRRESLPSGLRDVDKLWREMDDVVESLVTGFPYRDMTPDQLKGYAKGVAFSIVLLDTSFFPDIESVSRHARDRRKMRIGEMPHVDTPSRFSSQTTVQEAAQLHDAGPVPKPAKAVPTNVQNGIKAGLQSGMFSAEELAATYNLTVAEVKSIASS
jgi:hypothetical protein